MKLAFKFEDGKVVRHEVFERTFKIGRSENCRVAIPSEHFSREHCLVELIDNVIYLTDLDSKNGIYINQIRIPNKLKVSFDTKYSLYIGECFLTIDITDDLKDKDHLSLATFSRVETEERYIPRVNTRRAQARPRLVKKKAVVEKPASSRMGLWLALLAVLAAAAFYQHRQNHLQSQAISSGKKK